MIMALTGKQKNYLRSVAHNKNPIVAIGNKGLTDAVMNELELVLEQHELVKIKLPGMDKAEKKALLQQLATNSNSEEVQLIGNVGVLFRVAQESKIILP
jgi:RNA-binding protein